MDAEILAAYQALDAADRAEVDRLILALVLSQGQNQAVND